MQNNPDQLSTKEFFISVINFVNYILSKWQWLTIALLFGTSYDLIINSILDNEKKYTGQITFHTELNGGGTQGGQLMGLASSFGIGGGGVQGDLLGATNFEAIMMSLNVFQNALLKEIIVDGQKVLFINYFIENSDIKRNEWAGNLFRDQSSFSTYKFPKKVPEDFTPNENIMTTEIYAKLAKDTRIEPEDGTSLFQFYATTSDEKLTKIWMETLLSATEEFYKNMKTKKTRQMLSIQQERLDSLSYLLKSNDSRLARVTFDNPLVVDPSGKMKEAQLTRNNTYISNQYVQQLATVENLNRMVIEQTPMFTILEPVRLPLSSYKKIGISTRMSGLICLVVSIAVLSFVRAYQANFAE